ncbi:MAG: SirB1 family protein [Dongiaceae bacterium]
MQGSSAVTMEVDAALRQFGGAEDDAIDLAAAALALAARTRPGVDIAPYRAHLQALADDVAARVGRRVGEMPLDDRIATINGVLFDRHGYQGDSTTYDDLQNANLMSVIERRRGLPVALGILYVHAARAQGWPVEGLNFPGHFLLRLRQGERAAIIDPFHGGQRCETADLRALIKAVEGATAELVPSHCQPASNRQILLRLQNNLKLRLMRDERIDQAVAIIEGMLLLAPDEPRLWHEAGVLHGRLGNLRAAIAALENLVALNRSSDRHGAAVRLLAEMKSRLN